MKKKLFLTVLVVSCVIGFSFLATSSAQASSLASRLSGRILLQVQEHGEAWYVVPSLLKRVYLGRMFDAYDLFRNYGIGITNQDLTKIPVADFNFLSSPDSDGDGISDAMETGFGTNINNKDSDGDGYSDKVEVVNGYSPINIDKNKVTDQVFANKQKGKIFLQVENLGEAWYVNPVDGKRYYMGRPEDAWAVLVYFGLGITNANLVKIPVVQ
jgi:hypothetical protein